jgi:hypothetical protein
MIHKIVIGFLGIIYEISKNKSVVGYELALFSVDGKLISFVYCPGLDYSSWERLDAKLGVGVSYILVWKNSMGAFNSKETESLLNFIKEDRDPLVHDEAESERRASLTAELVSPSCLRVTLPTLNLLDAISK